MKIFIGMFLLMNIFIYNETNYEMFKFRKLNEKMPDELQKCSKLLMLLFFYFSNYCSGRWDVLVPLL